MNTNEDNDEIIKNILDAAKNKNKDKTNRKFSILLITAIFLGIICIALIFINAHSLSLSLIVSALLISIITLTYRYIYGGLKDYYKSLLMKLHFYADHEQHELANYVHTFNHNIRDSFYMSNNIDYAGLCENIKKSIAVLWKLDRDSGVRVCIKRFVDDNTIITFVESKYKGRTTPKKYKPVSIEENTDFKVIIDRKADYFYCSDLSRKDFKIEFSKLYDVDYEYKNSTKNYTDKYKSTIVAPIRNDDHLLGFLCVDSLKKFEVSEKALFDSSVQYTLSFADAFYILLNEKITS